jgi:D-beta-D-heptose 7-phosphate kinase/D-beta-D-heptose 1-phosphate adenosyltransferase
MKTKKVLVIGDVMIDHYINGKCHRISPEAPVPVVNFISEEFKLGGAANLANNIASLNENVSILSIVGKDKSAKKIHELLEQFRINDIIIDSIERETTIKTRIMVDGHQIVRVDRENPDLLAEKDELNLLNKVSEQIANHEIILLSDYNKGTLTVNITKKIIELCTYQNKKVFIDPKSNDFNKYVDCTLIKPNLKEAELATGIKIIDNKTLEMACREITKITKCQILLITMSEKGVCLFEKNEMTILPAHAKEVVDVTGAGDTFLATFCKEILLGNSILSACEYANMASAIAVSKLGSSVVTEKDIQLFKSNLNVNLGIC